MLALVAAEASNRHGQPAQRFPLVLSGQQRHLQFIHQTSSDAWFYDSSCKFKLNCSYMFRLQPSLQFCEPPNSLVLFWLTSPSWSVLLPIKNLD